MAKIKQLYKFDFKDGINTKTMEWPNPMEITFYESDLEIVLVSHNDPIIITTTI